MTTPCLDADVPSLVDNTPPTESYTLSLHDALPISGRLGRGGGPLVLRIALLLGREFQDGFRNSRPSRRAIRDRKSTRLNSSHSQISYAVFCLKKKNRMRRKTRSYFAMVVLIAIQPF